MFVSSAITKIVFRGPRSQGYGFVTYESPEAASKAVSSLKDQEFDGRKINVEKVLPREQRPARPEGFVRRGAPRGSRGGRPIRSRSLPTGPISTTVIYIGNLPYNATEEDLTKMFDDYAVASVRIVRRKDSSSKGFGFVTFSSEEDQKRALADFVDASCDGRKLKVRAAYSEERRHAEEGKNGAEEDEEEEAA